MVTEVEVTLAALTRVGLKMDQDESKWIKMDQNGSNLDKLDFLIPEGGILANDHGATGLVGQLVAPGDTLDGHPVDKDFF